MSAASTSVPKQNQVLEFTLGEERYCVGIDAVAEIVKAGEVTPLPDTPERITGLMNLRGESTTIVDPKRVFDAPVTEGNDTGNHVVIFEMSGDHQVGWLVDRVHQVTELEDPDLDPAEDDKYIKSIVSDEVADRFVLWVDPEPLNEPNTT